MSGIISDNTDKESGLIKTPSTGAPSSGSSDPTVSTNPDAVGDRFINTTSGELFVATDVTAGENVWKGQLGSSVEPATWFGGRMLLWGGYTSPGLTDVIEYIAIATTGNATDFGDATFAGRFRTGTSDGSRGVMGPGGETSTKVTTIDYVTISTLGDAADFGDATEESNHTGGALSNGTRGVWGNRNRTGGGQTDTMDYITIQSLGNATDFGDSSTTKLNSGTASNGTRGCWGGGSSNADGYANVIDYVIIASVGNASDFGDLTTSDNYRAGTSNGTRGVIGGGSDASACANEINYFTIASLGNATDFGDLTVCRTTYSDCADCNGTRACFGPGEQDNDMIDYITVASTGNATDFGDTSIAAYSKGACSGD